MKTIARVYDTYGQARQVVDDLEASGIASSDINLIANKYVCDETADIEEPSAAGPGKSAAATSSRSASRSCTRRARTRRRSPSTR
jgi:hypothetical protein